MTFSLDIDNVNVMSCSQSHELQWMWHSPWHDIVSGNRQCQCHKLQWMSYSPSHGIVSWHWQCQCHELQWMSWVAVNVMSCSECHIHCNSWHWPCTFSATIKTPTWVLSHIPHILYILHVSFLTLGLVRTSGLKTLILQIHYDNKEDDIDQGIDVHICICECICIFVCIFMCICICICIHE